MKIQRTIILLGAVWVCATASAATRAVDDRNDRWQFISTPFLWGTGIEGDITRRGITVNVDLGFDDLLDVTEYGFQTYLELRKRKFGFYAAPSYLKLSGDADSKLGSADFEQHFWLVEGGGFYNLIHTRSERPFTLDAYAGVRYWNIDTTVEIKGAGRRGADLEFGGTVDVIDPIIGLRMRQYLTKKLSLGVRGDIGGFGISETDTSDFSWHATALVGYDISKKFTVYGGYRVLDIETDHGSGSSKRGVDLTFQGALLGLQITW